MAKLVLDIDPEVIEDMTKSAEELHLSLSGYVEQFFIKKEANAAVAPHLKKEHELSDWVRSLVLAKEPTPDFDHKAEYGKHLEEKYGV
ncbi:DUF6364 family protein [Mucilaginibacter ginkgonis]|uniref:Uncharacterized protein n=1 Tax=Mucilaginibacter ginkgonis TaxID=2682091 RepID=A0A6I4I4J2_9SPHI|nr:DUF6364 family protein [Mucilaginibacter ginkgonis]QQL48926.1 hypothetical protein GO620_012145 [Mucilaginibacter ginkgonis]